MAAEDRDTQTQITLHYIDKLFAARQRLAEAAHRFFLIGIALSVVVLAISGGVASTDQALKVAGIGLKVPVAVLITFGAIVAGVLTLAFYSSLQHAGVIDKEIQRLYKDMEFKDRTLYAEIASPFRNENALTAFIGQFSLERYQEPAAGIEARPSYPVKMRMLIALLIVTPTAAQAGAGFKVSELLQSSGRLGWIWILFVLLAVLTAALLLTVPESHEHFQGEREWSLSSKRGEFLLTSLLAAIVALPGIGLGYIVAKVLAGLIASQ